MYEVLPAVGIFPLGPHRACSAGEEMLRVFGLLQGPCQGLDLVGARGASILVLSVSARCGIGGMDQPSPPPHATARPRIRISYPWPQSPTAGALPG